MDTSCGGAIIIVSLATIATLTIAIAKKLAILCEI